MLPSVIVGESAGMLKLCAASEAWPGWNAAWLSILSSRSPICVPLTSFRAMVAELLSGGARRRPVRRSN
jgi:hypothetical protein